MNYQITLGKYKVAHLLSCEIRKSANKLSDTATINLNGMAYGKTLEVESKIKRGDSVGIRLGYGDKLHPEFSGYITSISSDNNIVIECEDGMFLMRKPVKSKQYKKVSLTDILEDLADQIGGFTVVKGEGVSFIKYENFTVQNATSYEVLEKLKEETKTHIFVKGKELHVHLKYTWKEGFSKFDFSKNVEKSNLKRIKEEDKKVLVEVIGIDRKNNKKKVTVGEEGGDKITINRYNVMDEKALEIIGKGELENYKYNGFEGDIGTWLFPYCSYGYTAKLEDKDYPERQGEFYVSAVKTNFDNTGGRRKITLSLSLS